MITVGILKEHLHYEPDTGIFTWKIARANNKIKVGDRAGWAKEGYIKITLFNIEYMAQNLAWLYMTGKYPTLLVDHKDTVRNNNAWDNLREATRAQNSMNINLRSNNTSGIKGVSYHKQAKKWRAMLTVKGKLLHIGLFNTIEEAGSAVASHRAHYHGEFANHG